MKRSRSKLVLICLACLAPAGCRQSPPPPSDAPPSSSLQSPPQNTVPPAGSPAPPPGSTAASTPATKPAHRYERPPIDENSTAGVRGTQFVDFIVTAEGKRVQGAHIRVVTAAGKLEGDGKTDDWGEFKTALSTGNVKITAEWNGKKLVRKLVVDNATHQIELNFSASAE